MSRRYIKVEFDPTVGFKTEDGRELQLILNADTMSLGARPKTDDDRLAQLDQYVAIGMEPQRAEQLPSVSSLGLDQG